MAVLRQHDTLPRLSPQGTGLADAYRAAKMAADRVGRHARRDFVEGTVIPFWVAIILIVIAVIGVTFTGLFWWHWSRRPKARGPETETTTGPLDLYRIPTLTFQHHEPELHGYFAPLYLDPSNRVDPQLASDAKTAVREYIASSEPGGNSTTTVTSDIKVPPPVGTMDLNEKI
jgi:hypothetical protein